MADIGDNTVFSPTDANNTSSTEPGFPEGMLRSRLNNAGRGLMGSVRRWWERGNAFQTATIAGSTYSVTYAGATPAQYRDGEIFRLKVNTSNNGACSLNVNSLGARNIKVMVGNELRDPTELEININYPHEFVYSDLNTCFILTSASRGWSVPIRQTFNIPYSTASAVDSTVLRLPLTNSAEYRIRGSLNILPGTGGGIIGVTYPGGGFIYSKAVAVFQSGQVQGVSAAAGDVLNVGSAVTTGFVSFECHVVSSGGSDFALNFRRATAGTDFTVRQGSYIEYFRVQ